jgi:hypothetical protein
VTFASRLFPHQDQAQALTRLLRVRARAYISISLIRDRRKGCRTRVQRPPTAPLLPIGRPNGPSALSVHKAARFTKTTNADVFLNHVISLGMRNRYFGEIGPKNHAGKRPLNAAITTRPLSRALRNGHWPLVARSHAIVLLHLKFRNFAQQRCAPRLLFGCVPTPWR